MTIEKLNPAQVKSLADILRSLAEHHNQAAAFFSGLYPIKSVDDTLAGMAQKVEKGLSLIEVIRVGGEIIAFCQCTVEDQIGVLEYLAVLPGHRGKGYGKALMDRAMEHFASSHVKRIDVKVVFGNEGAERFYEGYGFRPRSKIMSVICQ